MQQQFPRSTPQDYGLHHDEFRAGQQEAIEFCLDSLHPEPPHGIVVLEAPTGCHAPGQLIMKYSGQLIPVEQVKPKDELMGWLGKKRTVQSTLHGFGEMYRINPVRGSSFIVNGNHILTLVRTNISSHGQNVRKDCIDGEIIDVSVVDYLTWSTSRKHLYKLFHVEVKKFSPRNALRPIDPYFLGILLGDGSLLHRVEITTMDREIVDEVQRQSKKYGLKAKTDSANTGRATSYTLSIDKGRGQNILFNQLKSLGLANTSCADKFIPFDYKTGDWKVRLEMLAGLIDTDGSLSAGVYDFISKSERLANDVAFISRSLGLSATVAVCQKSSQHGTVGIYHRVCISGDLSKVPCRLSRKQASNRLQKKTATRTGFSIEAIGVGEFYGFTLDGDGRYLLDDFLVTHNSGKTPIVKGLGVDHQVIALTRTKSLQAENYGGKYRFDVLFGRSNYPCVHDEARAYATAEDCLHGDKMHECPVASECQYLLKKQRAQSSQHAALNYSYWLTSRWPRESAASVLALDEAHLLSETVLDFAGITITEAQRREFGLPPFPAISSNVKRLSMSGSDPLASFYKSVSQPFQIVLDWLDRSQPTVAIEVARLKKTNDAKQLKKAQSLLRKIESTSGALGASHDDWYIRSGSGVRYTPNGNEPGLICRPLTARYHFPRYFVNLDKRGIVMMSATIGDVETFATELGIENYAFMQMPNQWAPETRPIMCLPGSPALGQAAKRDGGEAYEQQARIVAKAIADVPRDWSGVLHVTAKAEATLVAERLARAGLQDRIWVPSVMDGTDRQLTAWALEKRRIRTVYKAGAIAITWSWSTGVDLTEERICGVLKCFTPDVQLLGPDGLISSESAYEGQSVFAVDATGKMIVDKIIAVIKQKWDGPVITFKTEAIDVTVTDNHNMLVKRDYKNSIWNYQHLEAREIKHRVQFPVVPDSWSGELSIPSIADYVEEKDTRWLDNKTIVGIGHKSKPINIEWETNDALKLFGWFVSEGWARHDKNTRSIKLTQNKGALLKEMKDCLTRMKIPFVIQRKDRQRECYDLTITNGTLYRAFTDWFGTGARNKRLPIWLRNLPVEQLQIVFRAMMQGDGGVNSRTGSLTYSTSSEQLALHVVEICLKIGYRPVFKRIRNGNIDIGIATKRIDGTVHKQNVTQQDYHAEVWCVTTQSGNVLATRNGRFVFTGQCPFPFLGDPYERERQMYDGKFYLQRTAWELTQALGRTRRGEVEDYDHDGQREQLVFIADKNWKRVQKYIPTDVRQAIVEG